MIIKICGITHIDDAKYALNAGADWIGLNLVAGPRKLEFSQAMQIAEQLDDPSRVVVLYFVEQEQLNNDMIISLRDYGVRRLQLYGDVTPTIITQLRDEQIVSIVVQPVKNDSSVSDLNSWHEQCDPNKPEYILFDAASVSQLGGTGKQVNWDILEAAQKRGDFVHYPPWMLAGGINPENVKEAIRRIAPAGIDVCSGVESVPGKKDKSKIDALILAIRNLSHS